MAGLTYVMLAHDWKKETLGEGPYVRICTSMWLLTAGFQTLLPIHTHIQYRHTQYNTIPTVIYPQLYTFPPPPYQTHATNLGSMDMLLHAMKIKVSPKDYETHQSALSYAYYLGSSVIHCPQQISLDPILCFSIICATICSFLSETSRSILLYHSYQYWPL